MAIRSDYYGSLYQSLSRDLAAPKASGSALSKIGRGWGKTVGELPEAARDKLVRTAHAIANPIDTAKAKIAQFKEQPSRVLVPLGITAGSILLSAIAPPLMAAAGAVMTASLVVSPTIRFAKAKTDEELDAVSHQASRQLIDYGASMAAGWAIGKALKAGTAYLEKRKGAPSGAHGAATVGEVTVDQVPKTPRYDVDVPKLRDMVKTDMLAELKAANPGKSASDLAAMLESSEVKREMVQRVRKLVHLDYLKDAGLSADAAKGLTPADSAKLRRYFQDLGGGAVATTSDAARGANAALKASADLTTVLTAAERSVYQGRGIAPETFDAFIKAGYKPDDMARIRRFVDYIAPSQGRTYLPKALEAGLGKAPNLTAVRSAVTRQVMTDMGFALPKDVSYGTMIDLLGDLGQETTDNTRRIVGWVNEAFARGERDYVAIRKGVLTNLLGEVGVSPEALRALEAARFVDDAQGWKMSPDLKSLINQVGESQAREIHGRLSAYEQLRNRLRVLPDAQRYEAAKLASVASDPLRFQSEFAALMERQTAHLVGGDAKLARTLLDGMRDQQKANFVSSLQRMDPVTRGKVFGGLSGEKALVEKQIIDRLQPLVESQFEVRMHREAKAAIFPHWSDKKAASVVDWDPHGALELYNGLADMRLPTGQVPDTLKGTIFAREGKVPGTGLPDHMMPGGRGYRTGYKGQDLVVLKPGALVGDNSSRPLGIPTAEGTIVHEAAHAMQLGGPTPYHYPTTVADEQRLVGEWSRLSRWAEPDKSVADRYWKTPDGLRSYYKDGSVSLGDRSTLVSKYAATDTVEDFAEFARYFYTDPVAAYKVSPEKYVYLNQFVGGHYTANQALSHAKAAGQGAASLQSAVNALRTHFGIAV